MSKNQPQKPGLSKQLFKTQAKNPFVRTKAKNDPSHVIASDFLPTHSFWDLFSTTNQVVIGGRGTGKTMLMRMLCPSVFRNRPDIVEYLRNQSTYYVGFWVPFELRWITQIYDNVETYSQNGFSKNEIFEVVFNCRAFCSLCREIEHLVDLHFKNDRHRSELVKRDILHHMLIVLNWDLASCTSISQMCNLFGAKFLKARASKFSDLNGLDTMRASFLEPCEEIARFTGEYLCGIIEHEAIVWMACFDEGEYLEDPQLKIINTIMRSEGVEMTIKMTTLPSHYTTFHTLKEDSPVKPGGHDFSFVHIDFKADSSEFKSLCDNLISRRLKTIDIFRNVQDEHITLRRFLGSGNNKTLTELYSFYCEKSRQELLNDVARLLRERSRKRSYVPHEKAIQRFTPIVAYKYLEHALARGNSGGVTESGADRLKALSEGNIREFLRIMAKLFTHSRLEDLGQLKQKTQHKIAHKYLKLRVTEALGIQSVGLFLEQLIGRLEEDTRNYFYKSLLSEGGSRFQPRFYIDEFPEIVEIVKQGVASGYFLLDEESAEHPIGPETTVKIAESLLASFRVMPRPNLIKLKSSMKDSDHLDLFLPLFNFDGTLMKGEVTRNDN